MTLTGQTEVIGDKPISVPRCRPQIPHELSSYLTGPSAVRGWTHKDVFVGCLFCFVSGCSGTYTALQCYSCDLLCKIALMKHSPSFLVSKCKKPVLCSAFVNDKLIGTEWLLLCCSATPTAVTYRCVDHIRYGTLHTRVKLSTSSFVQRFQDGT
jgi:hypothetical protein